MVSVAVECSVEAFEKSAYLEKIRDTFSQDRYASSATKLRILDAEPGYAKVMFDIQECHLNADGKPMGGIFFTAADFAFAIASNGEKMGTVTVSATIQYLNAAKGNSVIAEARCDKDGKRLCFYTVEIFDENDVDIARVSITGMHVA